MGKKNTVYAIIKAIGFMIIIIIIAIVMIFGFSAGYALNDEFSGFLAGTTLIVFLSNGLKTGFIIYLIGHFLCIIADIEYNTRQTYITNQVILEELNK